MHEPFANAGELEEVKPALQFRRVRLAASRREQGSTDFQ
jgi:hypothetical protein